MLIISFKKLVTEAKDLGMHQLQWVLEVWKKIGGVLISSYRIERGAPPKGCNRIRYLILATSKWVLGLGCVGKSTQMGELRKEVDLCA